MADTWPEFQEVMAALVALGCEWGQEPRLMIQTTDTTLGVGAFFPGVELTPERKAVLAEVVELLQEAVRGRRPAVEAQGGAGPGRRQLSVGVPAYRLTPDGRIVAVPQPRRRRRRRRSAATRLRSKRRWTLVSIQQRQRQPYCASCGSVNDLTADHIIPLAKGGAPFDFANLQTHCRSCNSDKGASTRGGGGRSRTRPRGAETPSPVSPPTTKRPNSLWRRGSGEPLSPRIRRREERDERDLEWFQMVEKAIREGADLSNLPGQPSKVAPRSAEGDAYRLRGIPAIGPGVTGAIPGTAPHAQKRLDRWSGHG